MILMNIYTDNNIFRWPELVPSLLAHIRSGDVLKVYNSLLAMRKLVKRYEYKAK